MILHDAGATVAVMTGAYALVATFDNLTQRNIIQQVIIYIQWILMNIFQNLLNYIDRSLLLCVN